MPYLIVVSLVWGFSFIIIKGSLASLDSGIVSFIRLLLSLILFIPLVRPAGLTMREKLQLMLIGSLQFGMMYLAYIAAFRDLPAHVIALLTTTTPVLVSVFAGLYSGSIHKTLLVVALTAVAGGAVLQFPDQPLVLNLRGILLVQISNAAFALGQIAYRRWMAARPRLRDKSIFAFPYLGAVAVTGLFSLFTTSFSRISIQPHQWLSLLYLGFIASGISFFLWNMGSRKVDEGTLAIMNNMKIPIAVLASFAILGENTSLVRLFIGCALLAASLYMNNRFAGITERTK